MRIGNAESTHKKPGQSHLVAMTKSIAKVTTVVVFLLAMLTVLYYAG